MYKFLRLTIRQLLYWSKYVSIDQTINFEVGFVCRIFGGECSQKKFPGGMREAGLFKEHS